MVGNGPDTLAHELSAHAAWLRQLARALVGNAAADDLVQDTMEAALRNPPAVDRPLRPWLRVVLGNAARMHWRSNARRSQREHQAVALAAISDEGPEPGLAKLELHRQLVDAVMALAEPYRETVVLRFVDGLSAADIARKLDVPAATVRSRLKRGLDNLRTDLERERGASWRFALAPLLSSAQLAPGTTAAALTGALAMKIAIGTAVTVAAITIAVAGWPRSSSSRENEPGPESHAPASIAKSPSSVPPHTEPPQRVRRFASSTERARFALALAERRKSQPPRPHKTYDFAGATVSRSKQAPPNHDAPKGKLDKSYIRDRIDDIKPLLAECFELARTDDESLAGLLTVEFVIDAEEEVGGYVREASIPEDTNDDAVMVANEGLRECVTETILSLEFEPPEGGGEVTVRYPFHFAVNEPE